MWPRKVNNGRIYIIPVFEEGLYLHSIGKIMFPRDVYLRAWNFLCWKLIIASKRIEWNKIQKTAFRIIKTILDFLFINLVSNIILVK